MSFQATPHSGIGEAKAIGLAAAYLCLTYGDKGHCGSAKDISDV